MADGNSYIDEIEAALKAAQQSPSTDQAPSPVVGTGLNPALPDYQAEIAKGLAALPSQPSPEQFGPPPPAAPYDMTNAAIHGLTIGLEEPARAALRATTGLLSGRTQGFDYPEAAAEIQRGREAYAAAHPWLNVGANVAGSLAGPMGAATDLIKGSSFLPKLAISTGTGAAAGGIQGAAENTASPSDMLQSAKTGAEWGAGLGAIAPTAGAIGSSIFPEVSPAARNMQALGVQPTPGKAVGGLPGAIENVVAQTPLLGRPIQEARGAVQEQINRAAVNQPLAVIGESLNPDTAAGHEAIAEMQTKLSNAYKNAIPTAGGVFDAQAATAVKDALANANLNLASPEEAEFKKFVQNRIIAKVQGSTLSGPDFQDIDQALGQDAHKFLQVDNPYYNKLGSAYLDLQGKMRDWLARVSPQNAEALTAANQAWRMAKPIELAAAKSTNPDGIFTPAQLRSAVRSTSSTPQFAAGGALMQKFANDAEMFPPGGVHNTSDLVGGGVLAATALEHLPEIMAHPWLASGAAALYPFMKAAYSNPGRRALTGLLGTVGQVPPAVGAMGPVAAQLAPQYAPAPGPYVSGLLNPNR